MTIEIMGLAWQVHLVDAHSPALMVGEETCRGTCWRVQQRIYISNELDTESSMRVIRHEVTHAVLWATQVASLEQFSEEHLCDFTAMWAPVVLDISSKIHRYLYFGGEVLQNENCTST